MIDKVYEIDFLPPTCGTTVNLISEYDLTKRKEKEVK